MRTFSLRYLVPVVSLLFSLNSFASVYESKDKQGNIHFADVSVVGGEKIILSETPQIYTSLQKLESVKPATKITSKQNAEEEYKLLQIDQPQNRSIVRNDQGLVEIRITVEPALKANHKIITLLDGGLVSKTEATQLQLANIDRGTHTLQLKIETKGGQVLAYSECINFHMQRPRKVN